MSTKDPLSNRGRTSSSPVRAHHYSLGSASFSPGSASFGSGSCRRGDERSPHLAMDRVTRHVSPARHKSLRNETIGEVTPRIPQPYKTSLSAVTSPVITMKTNSNSPSSKVGSNPRYQPLGLSRGGPVRATLSGRMTTDESHTAKASRAKSHDSTSRSRDQGKYDNDSERKERALSCDMLDGPAAMDAKETMPPYNAILAGGGFDNRRLNPKFASTPTRLPKSPYASTDYTNDKYSRLDSNVSANTLDSVFAPASPRNFDYSSESTDADHSFTNTTHYPGDGHINSSAPPATGSEDMSKQPLSGYVEGRVELAKCLEVEYVHIVDLSHKQLLKEKKKKRLPLPNEETAQLVSEMMSKFENRFHDKPDSCPATPQHNGALGSSKKTPKNSLGKKSLSSSITNFFRKMTLSPKTSKKPVQKKGSKRSKSAGRLEGNRSVADSSSSLMGGYREISVDYSSVSSDTRGSVDGSVQETSRGLTRTSPASSSILEEESADTKENSQGSRSHSQGRRSRKDISQNSPGGGGGSRREPGSTSTTRVYLKSIEDNTMTNRVDEKTVYKSFKEKQSPGYRRHTEAVSMRSQALKAVEISERSSMTGSAENRRSSSTTGPTSPLVIDSTYYTASDPSSTPRSEAKRVEDLNELNKQAFFGNQTREGSSVREDGNQATRQDNVSHDSGSENSLSNSGNLLQEPHTHNASPKSPDSSSHLQNGSHAELHTPKNIDQQKSPSYVKLSCSVSGYTKYPPTSLPKVSPAPATASPKECVEIATNNNIPQQNGKLHAEEETAQYTQYKPAGSNFVKGLSQKFEAYTHPKDNSVGDQRQQRTDRSKEANKPGNLIVHKANSVSPHHNQYVAAADSNSGANSFPSSHAKDVHTSPSSALVQDNEEATGKDAVDSHNIDFRKARRAFSRGNSDPADKPATKQPKSSYTNVPVLTSPANRAQLSHSHKAFDNVGARTSLVEEQDEQEEVKKQRTDSMHNTELHLDLNGASRENGIDETDDAVFENSSRDLHEVGVTSDMDVVHNLKLPSDCMVNGDVMENDIMTPSEVKIAARKSGDSPRENDESLSQSNLSLDRTIDSLSSDHQVANGSTGTLSSTSSSQPSKDGRYFLAVVQSAEDGLNEHVTRTEAYLTDIMSEEVLGKIRAAIGKANLLISKKFKQFRGLCHQNITQSSDEQFSTTAQDLAGFWDLVVIQIEDIYSLFSEIEKLRENGWKMESKKTPEVQKSVPSTPAKSAAKKSAPASCKATPRSAKSQQASKAREEARRRLLEAKKAGRHMRKTSENEDVAIFIA